MKHFNQEYFFINTIYVKNQYFRWENASYFPAYMTAIDMYEGVDTVLALWWFQKLW